MLLVETHGAPYDRGVQYGRQLAAPLRRRASRQPLQPGGPGEAGAIAGRMLAYLEAHEPAMLEEMRGVAAGAEVSFEAIFHTNVGSFVRYILAFPSDVSGEPHSPEAIDLTRGDGCTNIAFAGTESGPLLGKTNDGGAPVLPERQPETWVLHHARPAGGPAYFMMAPVGALAGVAAMNEQGFVVGQSAAQVVPGQRGDGVPSNLMLRALVERCGTVEQALALLESRAMAGKGLNLMLLDAGGTVRAAEKSGQRLGVRQPDSRGVLYFSNHCHQPGLRDLPPRHDRANSLRRWANLQQRFGPGEAPVEPTAALMQQTISSHGEGAICQHGPDMFTSLGLLMSPVQRTLRAADGPPCSAPFVTHQL